jgi:phosphate uptake regulator
MEIRKEIRKMQLIGRGSFSITLPPDWVKEYKLKPRDQITITREDDGSLRLTPGIIPEEEKAVKITIDADRCKAPGLLGKLIVGGYIRGCDSIEIVSKHAISENHREEIRDAIDKLMGMGIVESTSNRVMLQSMVDVSKFPIRPLLKRLCGLSLSMYEDAMRALEDKDESLAAGVLQRENEVNKIYWLTQRQISIANLNKRILVKAGLKERSDIAPHRTYSTRVFWVANYAVDIANNQLAIGKNGVNVKELQKVIQLGKVVHKLFSNSCEAFFNGDLKLANDVVESFKPLDKMKDELLVDLCPRIKDSHLAMRLANIVRDLRGIARYAKSIAETTIGYSTAQKDNLP